MTVCAGKAVMIRVGLHERGYRSVHDSGSHAGYALLLFVLLFLQSLCFAFFEPGRSAVIPNITSAEEIPVANALGSATCP